MGATESAEEPQRRGAARLCVRHPTLGKRAATIPAASLARRYHYANSSVMRESRLFFCVRDTSWPTINAFIEVCDHNSVASIERNYSYSEWRAARATDLVCRVAERRGWEPNDKYFRERMWAQDECGSDATPQPKFLKHLTMRSWGCLVLVGPGRVMCARGAI